MSWSPEEFFAAEDAAALEQQATKPNGAAGPPSDHEPLLTPIDPTTLLDVPVPPRQWLVPDWVPLVRPTSIYGAGGDGKTLLAQMLATACALGKPWLGLRVLRCNSLLLFCEDDREEMHRRQDDINRHFDCTFADLGAMRWLPRLGDDNALMTFTDRARHTPLFDRLLDVAKDHHAGLVVTDTLADVFTGNENDRGQARVFAQSALGLLARETKGAVIALAHPSRAGMNSGSGESGSTAWIGTFRSQLYLSTPEDEEGAEADPNARTLTRKKSNAARRDETIEMRWHDGVFVPIRESTGIIASIERRSCERVTIELLEQTEKERQWVSSNSRAGNYAPRVFTRRPAPDREGFKVGDFERAVQALLSSGKIINQPYGRSGDERFRLAIVPNGHDREVAP